MGIQVAKIDVTENPSLSGRFFVTALPTIFHVINGEFRQYRGPRDSQTLEEFIAEKKWKNLETVPWYFYPDSFFMGAASYFFKLSHGLKVQLVKSFLAIVVAYLPTFVLGLEHLPFGTIFDTVVGQLRSICCCNNPNGCIDWFNVCVHR